MSTDDEIWAIARTRVWERAQGSCEGCGSAGRDVHHRQPRGMGGVRSLAAILAAHSLANLMLLCRACHDLTEQEPVMCRGIGWLVPHPTDPSCMPAYMRTVNGVGWYLLDTEGGYHWVDMERGDDDKQEGGSGRDDPATADREVGTAVVGDQPSGHGSGDGGDGDGRVW
jgi:5-methylcytosine-specific restriction enzyme A